MKLLLKHLLTQHANVCYVLLSFWIPEQNIWQEVKNPNKIWQDQ